MDKLICVGKNYLDHVKELGGPIPERPVLFLKPPSTVRFVEKGSDPLKVLLPRGRGAVHPECEIVLRLNAAGKVDAVTLGLDMTLRDVQGDLKKKGHPWEISKVFQDAAIVGPWIAVSEFPNFLEETFSLSIEGTVHQQARGNEMRFSPEECLSQAREYFPLCEGDAIFTGTPAGVTSVNPGQRAELRWGERLRFNVVFG